MNEPEVVVVAMAYIFPHALVYAVNVTRLVSRGFNVWHKFVQCSYYLHKVFIGSAPALK